MRRALITFLALVAILCYYAYSNAQTLNGVTTWQANQNALTDLQNQLNGIQAQVNALGTGTAIPQGGPLTTNINANGFKLNFLGAGVANGDSIEFGQSGAQLFGLNLLGGTLFSASASALNVNGVQNVQFYGTAGQPYTTTTGTIISGSRSLAVASGTNLIANSGILVYGAGPTATVTAPTIASVTPSCYSGTADPAVCTGAGPTCVPTYSGSGTCTAQGTTTYTYKAVALDAFGGFSAASAAVSTTVGVATLTNTAYNTIALSSPSAKAVAYVIYRNNNPIGAVEASTNGQTFDDVGQSTISATNIPTSPPASAGADYLETIITGVNGLTLTLSATASNNATSQFVATDDSPVFNLAIAAATASNKGSAVFVPPGTYNIGGPVIVSNTTGLTIQGASKGQSILKAGNTMTFLPMVQFVNDAECGLADVSMMSQGSSNPPIAAVNFNVNAPSAVTPIRDRLERVLIGNLSSNGFVNGVAWTAAPTFDQNNEQTTLYDVYISQYSNYCMWIGHTNSEWHKVYGGSCAFGPEGIVSNGGQISTFGLRMDLNYTQGRSFDVDLKTGLYADQSSFFSMHDESPNGTGIIRTSNTATGMGNAAGASFYDFRSNESASGNDVSIDVQNFNVTFDASQLINGPGRATGGAGSTNVNLLNSFLALGTFKANFPIVQLGNTYNSFTFTDLNGTNADNVLLDNFTNKDSSSNRVVGKATDNSLILNNTTVTLQSATAVNSGNLTFAQRWLPANFEPLFATVAQASLPATCTPGQMLYCSDCKNVADGVTMASTCVNAGTGSIAVCRATNTWKCGQ